ncbi:MAG: hypothetical protein ACI9VN_000490 [Patescibacteria group bacterium]|jgi:hypothetical protein
MEFTVEGFDFYWHFNFDYLVNITLNKKSA